MRDLDLANVEAATEYKRLSAGGYICKITKVTDVPMNQNTGKGDYLKIEYDVTQGEFKNYFSDLFASKDFWGGSFIRSYKESALSFFKAFTTSVENSNKGFVFGNDEQKLVGKAIGLVLGEEEYNANDGSMKNRLYVKDVRSVDSIKKNDFEVPELKMLAGSQSTSRPIPNQTAGDGFANIADGIDESLPFN